SRVPPLRGRGRAATGPRPGPSRAPRRDGATAGLPADSPGARSLRLSERGAAVGAVPVAAVLPAPDRCGGGLGRDGPRGGARGLMAQHLARLVLVGLLLLVPIWGRDHAARLPWLYLVMLAFAVALFAAPIARAIALWRGILDMPGARMMHEVATPLLGGAAVYCAFAVTVLTSSDFSLQLKGVAVGATLIAWIGILDDMTDSSA